MASIDRIRDAVQSLRDIYSKNPFSQSPATEVEIPTKLARRLEPYRIRGRAQVSAGALSGYFEAAFDLYAGVLQDQRYLTVKAELNQNGNYPESSLSNDVLVKQLPYPRHSGSAPGVEGEIPSQIFSAQSHPAGVREQVTVRYSLSGLQPGRIGLQWKINRFSVAVDCYPNGGDGLASAPRGLNRQLQFRCTQPLRTDGMPASRQAWLVVNLYAATGQLLSRFNQTADLHFRVGYTQDSGKADLSVQILQAIRGEGGDNKPAVRIRVRNEGNATAAGRVELDTYPQIDGACRWPHDSRQPLPALAPGATTELLFYGDYCHGRPGTYRVNASFEQILLTARVVAARGRDINPGNNRDSLLLKDAFRDEPSAALRPRINSVLLLAPERRVVGNCRSRVTQLRIVGGPFRAPVNAVLQHVSLVTPGRAALGRDAYQLTVTSQSSQSLIATVQSCAVENSELGVPVIQLHFANGERSRWARITRAWSPSGHE